MRTETIFDRVPGCGDLKKAKRAANYLIKQLRALEPTENLHGSRHYDDRIRRMYRRQAMLKP